MRASKQKQRGFTIVELLIVIVVIGILAAITIVAYNGIQERARASSATSALTQAAKKLAVYQVDNPDSYPADRAALDALGVKDSTSVSYQYTRTAGPP
jgi:type II secretion system protein G